MKRILSVLLFVTMLLGTCHAFAQETTTKENETTTSQVEQNTEEASEDITSTPKGVFRRG